MAKRYWLIRGHEKGGAFFEVTIPCGSITDDKLKELLKCLSARAHELPYVEIVGAYVKRKTDSHTGC
jgi:hypothetical protein